MWFMVCKGEVWSRAEGKNIAVCLGGGEAAGGDKEKCGPPCVLVEDGKCIETGTSC